MSSYSRVRSRWSVVLTVVGAASAAVAIAGLLLRLHAWQSNPLLAVAAFTPYLMIGSLIGLALLLLARSWKLGAVAVIVVAGCALTQADLYFAAPAPPTSVALSVMTANLRLGAADPAVVVRLVRDHHVGVLALQELTPAEVGALLGAGLDAELPYSSLAPGEGAEGVGLWSRFPLDDQPKPTGLTFQIVVARVAVPGVVPSPVAVSAHMAGPWPGPTAWRSDVARMPSILAELSSQAGAGSVVVGGDFNSTPDTAQFRSLLVAGFSDAAEQAGAGMTRTYPGDTWYPPLIAIDHVLTLNAVATSAATLTVPGSDHRALLTSIALPT